MKIIKFFKDVNRILAGINTVFFVLGLPFSIMIIYSCVSTHEAMNAAGMLVAANLFFLILMVLFWLLTAIFSFVEKKHTSTSELSKDDFSESDNSSLGE